MLHIWKSLSIIIGLEPEHLCSTASTNIQLPLHHTNAYAPVQLLSILGRKNGYAAITDANLVLGRILPEFFPSIFGEDEKQPLDAEASKEALQKIAHEVNDQAKSTGQPEKSVEEVCKAGLCCPPDFLSLCLCQSVHVCVHVSIRRVCVITCCTISLVQLVLYVRSLWLRVAPLKLLGTYMAAACVSYMQSERN